MADELGESGEGIAVRSGTGTRRSGRAAAERILKSAHALLEKGGQAQFSMRNVAAEAGLHLANVQYYFPTRDALIGALLQDVGRRYREAYLACRAKAPAEADARFAAILDFNLQDIAKRGTRRYFVQLWALLDGLDGSSGKRLAELYKIDIEQLSEAIAEIDSKAGAVDVRRRATLLASVIEGLMVVHGAHSTDSKEMTKLVAKARELCLAIAMGRAA